MAKIHFCLSCNGLNCCKVLERAFHCTGNGRPCSLKILDLFFCYGSIQYQKFAEILLELTWSILVSTHTRETALLDLLTSQFWLRGSIICLKVLAVRMEAN